MRLPPTENVLFQNNKGQRLSGKLYFPEKPSSRGLVFCHGFYSSKDATKIVRMSADIAAAGFVLLAFDFSFICIPGTFSDFSILQEVEDLRSAISFMQGRGTEEVHLMGSSMGGAVALLYASEQRLAPASLICIATPVRLGALLSKGAGCDISSLSEDGLTPIDGIAIKNSFFREAATLDINGKAGRIHAPTLVIHGKDDAVVDYEDSGILMSALRGEKKLVTIGDGDHNLTGDPHLSIIRRESVLWLEMHSGL